MTPLRDPRSGARVALLSLEPWDQVWRRNQHLSRELTRQGLVRELVFVEPASADPQPDRHPLPGVTVHQPRRRLPLRLQGHRETAVRLRRGPLRGLDLLWVNDPDLGARCLGAAPAVYDVTDDWRAADLPAPARARLVAAEDVLARRARTVVCSQVLADRWKQRYGVSAPVVHNGVDLEQLRAAVPREIPGPGPHVGYVGTLHDERLDVPLVLDLAARPEIGTVHLVGPDALTPASRAALVSAGVVLLGPVPSSAVPGWLLGLDVLLCPHVVTPFTLSLDAIKSYEYASSGRPVVATPTSGFQHIGEPVVTVGQEQFVAAVVTACTAAATAGRDDLGWPQRAREFAAAAGIA